MIVAKMFSRWNVAFCGFLAFVATCIALFAHHLNWDSAIWTHFYTTIQIDDAVETDVRVTRQPALQIDSPKPQAGDLLLKSPFDPGRRRFTRSPAATAPQPIESPPKLLGRMERDGQIAAFIQFGSSPPIEVVPGDETSFGSVKEINADNVVFGTDDGDRRVSLYD